MAGVRTEEVGQTRFYIKGCQQYPSDLRRPAFRVCEIREPPAGLLQFPNRMQPCLAHSHRGPAALESTMVPWLHFKGR